jgi:pterin-4a-carbinolamine dehydratase
MSNPSNRSTTPQVQDLEGSGGTGLKAERIQFAPPAETRLKAERIQIQLRDLPGWNLQRGGTRIARTFEVPDAREAARFLQYVVDLGLNGFPLPDVNLTRGAVTFSLPTVDDGWLETQVFELAQALEVKK